MAGVFDGCDIICRGFEAHKMLERQCYSIFRFAWWTHHGDDNQPTNHHHLTQQKDNTQRSLCVYVLLSYLYCTLSTLQLHTKKYRMDSLLALNLPKKKNQKKKIYGESIEERDNISNAPGTFFFAWSLPYLSSSFYLTLFVYFSFSLRKLRERKDFYKNLLCKQWILSFEKRHNLA